MPAVDSALVIGAGPAGLASAIGLRLGGVSEVEVVEASADNDVIGSELCLGGPMLRALDTLGVAEECARRGVGIAEVTFRDAAGNITATRPFHAVARPALPPAVGITRPELYAVLADRARALGVTVRYRLAAVDVTDIGSETVDVTLSDDTTRTPDLVVGAGGVGFELRNSILPQSPEPQYVGQSAWRARVRRGDTEPLLTTLYGHGAKAGYITVSEEYGYIFCLVTVPEFVRLPRDQFPELLKTQLAEFGEPITSGMSSIENANHIHYSPLTPLIVAAPWHRGRVVLVGDAVHATTPHLAYGAGLAVEDGVVLGEEIGRATDVGSALRTFTERRYERCRMTVDNGVQLSRWEQAPDTPGADFVGLSSSSQAALAEPI